MIKAMAKVFKSVRDYKVYAIITPLFMIGEAAVESALPFFMSVFVGKIEGISNIFELTPYILILFCLTAISITCGVLGGRFASIASSGFAKNLRNDLYKKISSFSFENIDRFQASSLVTRMTTDVNNAQMSFGMILRIVIRAPLMLIFSAVMAFITGGNMAWIFIVTIPVIGLIFIFIARAAMKIFRRVFKRYDALNQSVQENVSGIRVVKSFVREEYEKEKFTTASNNMAKDFIKAEKIVALMNPMMNTAIHAVYLLVLYFASTIIFKTVKVIGPNEWEWGELSIPQMSALLTYGIQILMSIMMISMIVTMLIMSLESIRRIGEILDEKPTITNPENPITTVNDGSVVFENVAFKYKKEAERYAVKNIDINIESGQFVGIIGSTGSGKTTLVNLISRLYDVTQGTLLVGHHSVKEYDLKTLRDAVAVVLQKNYLFSGTIRSNMHWGDKNASDEEIMEAINIAQISEVVTSSEGLDRVVEQGGANFSGGQKQRLCIARALLKKPKILILDDSTSAVDTKTDKKIRKALKKDLPHITKIVIAQRISSIEDADQIIVMDNGQIDAIGTHQELLKTNEIYQEVYTSQTQKGEN
ncbi:MAG TPA: ABC transporter ATP-binding protein [Erysipelotrichaceae bacterium]|nr:ABC transporter ATP-binding protein [Erysipelotrichaceae bacterium]